MQKRSWVEWLALLVGLPLLLVVSVFTWRLWDHVQMLDHSLAESKQVEISLLSQLRDAVGREALAGKALRQMLLERDSALSAAERARLEAETAQEEAARQSQVAERLRLQRGAELDRMSEALGQIAETDRTPMGMVVQLGADSFLFDFDSDVLRPANREILSRIAGVLLASYGYKVYVYGHTDDVGDAAYNQGLSERRARAVRSYLTEAGIPDEILDWKGFGKTSPRVAGQSREARQRNRRVEIGIVDTVVEYRTEVSAEQP